MNYQRYLAPAAVGVAAIAVLALLGLPVVAFLPYLLFLACPLTMVFMMRGMNHGGGGHGSHHHTDEPGENLTERDDAR